MNYELTYGACDMVELFRIFTQARLCFSLDSHRKITSIFRVRINIYKSYSHPHAQTDKLPGTRYTLASLRWLHNLCAMYFRLARDEMRWEETRQNVYSSKHSKCVSFLGLALASAPSVCIKSYVGVETAHITQKSRWDLEVDKIMNKSIPSHGSTRFECFAKHKQPYKKTKRIKRRIKSNEINLPLSPLTDYASLKLDTFIANEFRIYEFGSVATRHSLSARNGKDSC